MVGGPGPADAGGDRRRPDRCPHPPPLRARPQRVGAPGGTALEQFEGRAYTATSPDGSTWVHFRQDEDGRALWWSGARDEHGNGWTAQFAPSTPMHLVQAFSAALASAEPVMRPRGRVPRSGQIRTTSVSVLPSQLSAWQPARIAAARAATWARNWSADRPGTTPHPDIRAPAGGARARR